MESRFARLRQRDASVSMLRTKMSRRRSQSQKENRERAVNTRRQLSALDRIEEIKPASSKVEERLKQLERWKERKALEKEKSKREKERKGVFKTGLYHPKDTLGVAPLPDVPAAPTRTKGKQLDSCQSTRVTRSMKQQPLRMEDPNIGARRAPAAVERSSRTRGAGRPAPAAAKTCGDNRPAAARPERDQPRRPADVRITRSRRPAAPAAVGGKKAKETPRPAVLQEETPSDAPTSGRDEVPAPPACPQEEEAMEVEPASPVDPGQPPPSRISFAPAGFVFQAPVGLPAFQFDPMTPRSADAFLTPSPAPGPPPPPQAEPGKPSCPPAAPSPPESEHDVPYFRRQVAAETERLTTLSLRWEPKVEDEAIPEDMRDAMRTAVGQARLLMKERFNQFAGLVDDCELRRGDKVTTCSDLQGFWDMVSYQVEDVKQKFAALMDAEGRGWAAERRPPPRQRKAVKKPAAAPAKPPGDKAAAARSRLAAVKAAMKARQRAEQDQLNPGKAPPSPRPRVVPGGGFLQVESPVAPPGSVRRSRRLSAAAPPPPPPCSTFLSPRRITRRSLAPPPASPAPPPASPAPLPASPALLPASPAPLPASPAPLPASPAPLPASPALLPASPAPLPASPAPLPASPAPLPASPALLPASPAPLPASPAPLPASPALLPASPAPLPASPAPLPASPAPLPASPALLPASPAPLPASPAPLPASPALLPASPAPLPASPAPLPASPAPLPASPASPQLPLLLQRTPSAAPLRPVGGDSLCFSPVNQVFSGAAGREEGGCVPQLVTPRRSPPAAGSPASPAWKALPGLDFERYLRPSLRGSPSPLHTDCSDVWSPAAAAETTSPTGGRDDHDAAGGTDVAVATPAASPVSQLQSPQVGAAASPMLLFTPDIGDKIRQSVCPTDLMIFTPPSL